MRLFRPLEQIVLPEKFEERESPLPELGDESAQGSHAAHQLLHLLDASRGSHLLDGLNLFGVGLDSSVGNQETKELPRSDPKNAFL